MKVIMVIPGAAAQIPLIKRLKELNFQVVCVNPYDDSPAFAYADFSEKYNILNLEACIEVAQKYNVCAVISDECDIAMPTVAAVSETLNIPSIGSALARLYTNKKEMRVFSEKHGFPCPAYKQCNTLEEAKNFFESLNVSKMIIKPLDSNSSRGVYTITSLEELNAKFDDSMTYSRTLKVVLCEEYIEGTEFTVDGVVLNGKHYSLAISRKKHYPHHPNIACELYFSYEDLEFDYEKLRKQNDKYVEVSGLPFGFTHAEYKYNGKEFVLIEIGARGGGNYISSHIVPVMTGLDNYKMLVDQTLNLCIKDKDDYRIAPCFEDRCCVLKFFDIDEQNDGKVVDKIVGEEILKDNPKVLLYQFQFKSGEVMHIAADDSKRVGFYIAYGDTRKELDSFIKMVDRKVKFIFK